MLDIHGLFFVLSKPNVIFWGLENGIKQLESWPFNPLGYYIGFFTAVSMRWPWLRVIWLAGNARCNHIWVIWLNIEVEMKKKRIRQANSCPPKLDPSCTLAYTALAQPLDQPWLVALALTVVWFQLCQLVLLALLGLLHQQPPPSAPQRPSRSVPLHNFIPDSQMKKKKWKWIGIAEINLIHSR
jgi:hypothetical protein